MSDRLCSTVSAVIDAESILLRDDFHVLGRALPLKLLKKILFNSLNSSERKQRLFVASCVLGQIAELEFSEMLHTKPAAGLACRLAVSKI